jgi:hypothetical protein
MSVTHGFELVQRRQVDEIKTEARLYRHVKTGAQVLSMVNRDENKVFGITFRTPPMDSTGVAHILEHSVLCGSRKYPVKEPFVELLKGSLKTFLNAFTFPDKTCYPVASQNVQDFYNLIDVYLDAVFFPRLTPEVLMQEGWHYELESPDSPLTYQGVVFGEMKGVYSSPDSLLGEYSQQSVFPDNTYGLDSGGSPLAIPNLTFEAFKGFHERYYHPSNARAFFWGDDDPDDRLRILDAYLSEFEPRRVQSEVTLQPKLADPRAVRKSYASSEGEERPRAMLTVNWLLPEVADPGRDLALSVLEHTLVGMPASPLRKALIDSGLGEDLAGVGLEGDLRQMYFSTGLKGIDPSSAQQVERLIFEVLRELADNGIDKELLKASINTAEFQLREANTGSFPRGLSYMLRSLRCWLHDGDPLALLAFEAPLQIVKNAAQSTEPYFENLLRQHFLENTHRTTVLLSPDPCLGKRQEQDETERLAKARERMTPEDLQRVMQQAKALKDKQQRPDPPEDLAKIPTLAIGDLPRKNKVIPCDRSQLGADSITLYYHDLDTFGIAYVDLAFDLSVVPQEDLHLIPLFGRALTEMGTDKEDFVSLSRRISANTGGIWTDAFICPRADGEKNALWLIVRSKVMLDKTFELTAILRDVLTGTRLDDRERFRQIVLEEKAQAEHGLIPAGHAVVESRLRAAFGTPAWLEEQIGGISYLFALRNLVKQLDSDWNSVCQRLMRLRERLISKKNMIVNLTLDAGSYAACKNELAALVDSLPGTPRQEAAWAWSPGPRAEGLTMPAQVNYVGKAANLYDLGYKFHGSAHVITRFLRTGWLWDRVRVQGGAYGAFCKLERLSGVIALVSYRDPNLDRTLRTFDQSAQSLRDVPLSQKDIDKSIIGAIGDMDAYMLPDAKGYVAFMRALSGQTESERERIRGEVFETSEQHFRAFADVLGQLSDKGLVAVLGGQEGIEKAAGPLSLQLTRVL